MTLDEEYLDRTYEDVETTLADRVGVGYDGRQNFARNYDDLTL